MYANKNKTKNSKARTVATKADSTKLSSTDSRYDAGDYEAVPASIRKIRDARNKELEEQNAIPAEEIIARQEAEIAELKRQAAAGSAPSTMADKYRDAIDDLEDHPTFKNPESMADFGDYEAVASTARFAAAERDPNQKVFRAKPSVATRKVASPSDLSPGDYEAVAAAARHAVSPDEYLAAKEAQSDNEEPAESVAQDTDSGYMTDAEAARASRQAPSREVPEYTAPAPAPADNEVHSEPYTPPMAAQSPAASSSSDEVHSEPYTPPKAPQAPPAPVSAADYTVEEYVPPAQRNKYSDDGNYDVGGGPIYSPTSGKRIASFEDMAPGDYEAVADSSYDDSEMDLADGSYDFDKFLAGAPSLQTPRAPQPSPEESDWADLGPSVTEDIDDVDITDEQTRALTEAIAQETLNNQPGTQFEDIIDNVIAKVLERKKAEDAAKAAAQQPEQPEQSEQKPEEQKAEQPEQKAEEKPAEQPADEKPAEQAEAQPTAEKQTAEEPQKSAPSEVIDPSTPIEDIPALIMAQLDSADGEANDDDIRKSIDAALIGKLTTGELTLDSVQSVRNKILDEIHEMQEEEARILAQLEGKPEKHPFDPDFLPADIAVEDIPDAVIAELDNIEGEVSDDEVKESIDKVMIAKLAKGELTLDDFQDARESIFDTLGIETAEEQAEETEPEPVEETEPEPVEEAVEEPTEPEPVEEAVEELAEPEPVEKVAEELTEPEPVEETVEETTEPEPVEESVEEPTQPEPVEEAVEEPTEPVEEAEPEPVEEMVEEPTESEPLEETAEEEPIQGPDVELSEAEEQTEESSEELIEEPVVEPVEEPIEETAEEPAEEATEESGEEPVEEVAEEPVEESVDEPVEVSAEEPVEEEAAQEQAPAEDEHAQDQETPSEDEEEKEETIGIPVPKEPTVLEYDPYADVFVNPKDESEEPAEDEEETDESADEDDNAEEKADEESFDDEQPVNEETVSTEEPVAETEELDESEELLETPLSAAAVLAMQDQAEEADESEEPADEEPVEETEEEPAVEEVEESVEEAEPEQVEETEETEEAAEEEPETEGIEEVVEETEEETQPEQTEESEEADKPVEEPEEHDSVLDMQITFDDIFRNPFVNDFEPLETPEEPTEEATANNSEEVGTDEPETESEAEEEEPEPEEESEHEESPTEEQEPVEEEPAQEESPTEEQAPAEEEPAQEESPAEDKAPAEEETQQDEVSEEEPTPVDEEPAQEESPAEEPETPDEYAEAKEKRHEDMQNALLMAMIDDKEKTFSDAVNYMIDQDELNARTLRTRMPIDKDTLDRVIKERDFIPDKKTALAICFALRLTWEDSIRLLYKAGYSLNDTERYDLTIEYLMRRGVYDQNMINSVLRGSGLEGFGTPQSEI